MRPPMTEEGLRLLGYLAYHYQLDYDEGLVWLVRRVERAAAEREYQRLATRWEELQRSKAVVVKAELFDTRPMDREEDTT